MYHMPELYGTRNFISAAGAEETELCRNESVFRDKHPCDEDVYCLCTIIMKEENLQFSTDPYKCIDLYMKLMACLDQLIEDHEEHV